MRRFKLAVMGIVLIHLLAMPMISALFGREPDHVNQALNVHTWPQHMKEASHVPQIDYDLRLPMEPYLVRDVDKLTWNPITWLRTTRAVQSMIVADNWVAAVTERRLVIYQLDTGKRIWTLRGKRIATDTSKAALASDGKWLYWVTIERERAILNALEVGKKNTLRRRDLGDWAWNAWKDHERPGFWNAGLTVTESGLVVALSAKKDDNLFAFSHDLKEEYWRMTAPGQFLAGAAPVVFNNVAYGIVTSNPKSRIRETRVIAVVVKSGKRLWERTMPLAEWIKSTLVATPDGLLAYFRATLFRISYEDGSTIKVGEYGANRVSISSSKAYITDWGRVQGVDLNSGKLLFETKIGESLILGGPVPTANHVFVGSSDGWVRSLDNSTGKVLWEGNISTVGKKTLKRGVSALIVAHPFLIIGTDNGELVIYRESNE